MHGKRVELGLEGDGVEAVIQTLQIGERMGVMAR